MTRGRAVATGVLFLALGHAGCGGSGISAPSTIVQAPPPNPSPSPSARPRSLAVFIDPATGFLTTDVHDADGDVIRVDSGNELIWTADDRRFPEFIATGNFIGYHHAADHFFQVRFGTSHGESRAYVTWPDTRLQGATPTVLDLWVDAHGDLKVAETDVRVPEK